MTQNLLELESHFSFARIGLSTPRRLTKEGLRKQKRSLIRLVGREAIEDAHFWTSAAVGTVFLWRGATSLQKPSGRGLDPTACSPRVRP